MPSFYYPCLSENDKIVEIINEEAHHITNVFRLKVGDEIIVNNGKGILANSFIMDINKKKVKVKIEKVNFFGKQKPKIALAFSLLKNKNDLLLVEKITELGVTEIYPFISRNTVRKANDNTLDKFIKTTISAIKQCDNPFLPTINDVKNFEDSISEINKNYKLLVASEKKPKQTINSFINGNNFDDICLIIGPEGGFSNQEFDFLNENEAYFFKISNNILRAETAAIAALSQLIAEQIKIDNNY